MTVAWPSSLIGVDVLDSGYSESPADNVIRSPMDVGPAKLRRRGTSMPQRISWQQILASTNVGSLDTFYITTLAYGSLDFTRVHPRTGSTATTMRFLSPPTYSVVKDSPGNWVVSFDCEVLP